MELQGKKRIINFKHNDYANLYNTTIKEVQYEPVIVNDQVEYQAKTITKNVQDSLRDLKVSDFAMANALVSGLAANFKPTILAGNDVDGVIDSVAQMELSFDNISANGES